MTTINPIMERHSTHTKSQCPFSPLPSNKSERHDPSLFQSGYTQSDHHKRNSQITRSEIFYTLMKLRPRPCTPAYGYEFHASSVHPHPPFTAPLVRSVFGVWSEVHSKYDSAIGEGFYRPG